MELTNFSFNADIIQVFDEQGQYVSVKNLCKNIGIDFKTQYEKILSYEIFCQKYFKIKTKGGDHVALCIPVEKINGWLFSINPNKVKPEIKAKLILYKNECFNVLYRHFNAAKFQYYVDEISNLRAVQISQGRHNQNVINGYKSQLSQRNALIAKLRATPTGFKDLYLEASAQRDYFRRKYNEIYELLKFDKGERITIALAKIQKELDRVYSGIGAVMAYANEGDRYFLEHNEITKG